MLKPYDTRPVGDDGTATWANCPGVAFVLVPALGGTYPVTVVLDSNPAERTVVVTGPSEERGATPFTTLKLSGGTPGDMWTLFVATTAADVRRQGYLEDGAGRAIVSVASGQTLAWVDFTVDGALPADGAPTATSLYLRPGGAGFEAIPALVIGTRDPYMWDLRHVPRVRLSYQALAPAGDAGGVTGDLSFALEVYTSPWVGRLPLITLPLGITNEWADAGQGLGLQPLAGRLELNAPVDDRQPYSWRSSERANYCRVRLDKANGWPLVPGYVSNPGPGGLPVQCMATFAVEAL